MTLRGRIAATAATAVAVALVLAFAGLYVATRRTLVGNVDDALLEVTRDFRTFEVAPGSGAFGLRTGQFGAAVGYVQGVGVDGQVLAGRDGDLLPVDDRTIRVARGESEAFLSTVEVDGLPLRVLTAPTRFNVAIQVARPLDEVEASLADLRRQLAVFGVFGVGLASLLGLYVSRRAVRPVDELTGMAEEVAATRDLSRRIQVDGTDEIARLATTFNGMLSSLEQARQAQEQLVADASHELRTPLTSLRTNIEVLEHVDRLDEHARRALIDDVVVQLDEFGRLVGALVELARGDQLARGVVAVRLDDLVEQAVDRIQAFAPDGVTITLQAVPTTVVAEADRVERAVANLVDNAVKYGGGAVTVEVADGRVVVTDDGPGVSAEHRAQVFERFFRAPDARSAPGSGLGLSIVEQVATSHGGTVSVDDAPGGGARFTLAFPAATAPDADA